MHRIAIFASGTGSNAQQLINHFRNHPLIKVELVVSSMAGAGVLQIAATENITSLVLEKERFFRGDGYVAELKGRQITCIVLAGFLWKIPSQLIAAYPDKIINIHPALLPLYGGKGMYGRFVHEAVLLAEEKESGITIHYVDDQYDHGKTLFQARCAIDAGETPDSLAEKIHRLEHYHYPRVVEELVASGQQ